MTIPASVVAKVIPGVVSAGGAGLVLNGIILTTNTRVPIGAVQPFSSLAAVSTYFGAGATETLLAANYFSGFQNATLQPGLLYFVQYAQSAPVSAYTRGASVAALTVAQLQAISGTLSVTIDGSVKSGSVNLSAATSFSSAATIIATGLALTGGQTCTYDSVSGGFVITSGTTGATSTITLPTGTIAAALGFTAGVTSQGAAISTPSGAMTAISAVTQNWAAFTTAFEPVIADKLSFAAWVNGQNNRFCYVAWDSDVNAVVANNQTCFGAQLIANQSSGTCVIGGDTAQATALGVTLASLVMPVAAFVLGAIASINFGQTNGRITFAFKSQAGLVATCANQTTAAILNANGYNYYGAFATANAGFVFLYNGQVSGIFGFLDEYINQIWLNAQLQLALISLMTQVTSIPYNQQGYGLITAACLGPIQQALNFGAIRTGVVLSTAEAAEVNYAAGLPIANALSANGFYLQVLDPGAQARSTRSTPSITLWYMDGGSVQQITLASIDVQ